MGDVGREQARQGWPRGVWILILVPFQARGGFQQGHWELTLVCFWHLSAEPVR